MKTTQTRVTEAQVLAQIREALRILRLPHWRNVGSAFMEPGIPDLVVCLPPSGRMFLVEVKRPGKGATDKQSAFLERFRASGALGGVFDNLRALCVFLCENGYPEAGRFLCR